MRTIEVKILKFDELSEKAKERAVAAAKESDGYHFADDMLESITKLAEHFGGKIKDYEIDWFGGTRSSMSFEMPEEMDREEIARRLAELGSYNPETLKGNGDCVLTGSCGDEDCIDGFRIAFIQAGESDLEKLMKAAFETWIKSAQADCEGQYEDEAFSEYCDANNIEFHEAGRRYSGK